MSGTVVPPTGSADRSLPFERFAPAKSALLVIDVQNDFCAPGGFFDSIGHSLDRIDEAVSNIVAFLPLAKRAGLLTIFVRGIYDRHYLSRAMVDRHERMGYPIDHCHEGTWGAEFYRVAPQDGDLIVSKHRYSAFISTDLDAILRANEIENLFLGGIATNVCVESTARDGYMLDYHINFLSDCAATYDESLHRATLENIRRSFGLVVTSHEVAEAWKRSGVVAA